MLASPLSDLPARLTGSHAVSTVERMALPQRSVTTARWCFSALVILDLAGAGVAARRRIAGEPFGVGSTLDPQSAVVSAFWGTGLSAPLISLATTTAAALRRPALLRPAGALFALGALSEPVVWGRRPCPWPARAGVIGHVLLALVMSFPDRDISIVHG